MTAAKKKYIIGLTGNIATGKSVVRKMLEHLGAYGIDADALSNRVIAKGGPGFQAVVDEFGKFILGKDGNVDREKLGKVVFSDAEALTKLEEIVHPYVGQAVKHLIGQASQEVIVVEAIKLLESSLKDDADSIWVTTSSEKNQLARLAAKRGVGEAEAKERMAHQSSQAEKAAVSDVLIKNDGSIEDTWNQVQDNWKILFPDASTSDVIKVPTIPKPSAPGTDLTAAELIVGRAKPSQAEDIANFINHISGGKTNLTRIDIMTAFGEKAYMLLAAGNQLAGVVGWQVENLVARVDEVWLESGLDLSIALNVLMEEIENASQELQAEAAFVFVDPDLAKEAGIWKDLGYRVQLIEELQVNAWKEAAREYIQEGVELLFKQLRIDRILRPL